jgi:hypothetical protein
MIELVDRRIDVMLHTTAEGSSRFDHGARGDDKVENFFQRRHVHVFDSPADIGVKKLTLWDFFTQKNQFYLIVSSSNWCHLGALHGAIRCSAVQVVTL